MEKETIELLMIFFSIAVIFFSVGMFFCDYVSHDVEKDKFELIWACMDGCYNLLEVEHGEVDYFNTELKALHQQCSGECFNIYFGYEDVEYLSECSREYCFQATGHCFRVDWCS